MPPCTAEASIHKADWLSAWSRQRGFVGPAGKLRGGLVDRWASGVYESLSIYHSLYLPEINFSLPQALRMVKYTCLSPASSHIFFNSLQVTSSSAGNFRSSLRLPSSRMTLTKSSALMSATSSSSLLTLGTCMVAEVGAVSSYFLLVKMSLPTMVALADPCFPGLAVEQSVTLQGKPLSMQQPPFLTLPAAVGVQSEAPDSTCWNSSLSDIC